MREPRQRMWLQWRRMEKRIRAKDELYDVSMLRGYGCKNDGYGELLPSFSIQLAEVLNLTASNKLLDVGSGIGFLCFDLACISGCSVKGIEIRRDIFLKSVQIAKHVAERMKLDVSFVYGDATGDSFHFKNMDVIVCCNTLWSDENNYRLLQKLSVQMRPGTRVVVLEQLGGQRYHQRKSARQNNDILSSCFDLPPQKFHSEPGSVSWTSNSIPFYVYTKKKISRDMKERLERDRGNVLNAPKHRTDPHVVSFRGKKRAVVIEDDSDVEEITEMPVRKRVRGEDDDKSAEMMTKPVTRSSQVSKDSKDSKPAKPVRRRPRARLTMPRRRVNANPKARSRTRPQGQQNQEQKQQKQDQKQPQEQKQNQQKQEQKQKQKQQKPEQKQQEQQEEQHSPRQTRAQARALLSSTPPLPSFPPQAFSSPPRTRSRSANSSTPTTSPPSSSTATSTSSSSITSTTSSSTTSITSSSSSSSSSSSPSASLPLPLPPLVPPSKSAKRSFGKVSRQRPALKAITNEEVPTEVDSDISGEQTSESF